MPWCVRKCPYCDFNSHESSTEIPKDAYIQALIKDLQQDLKYVQGRKINSLFFGGGTPSLFSGDHYETLLRAIQLEVDFAPDIEITLEA
ncbi:MAG: YggW family oxidoreductase, partial [Gammaproteobacteria bacterium]